MKWNLTQQKNYTFELFSSSFQAADPPIELDPMAPLVNSGPETRRCKLKNYKNNKLRRRKVPPYNNCNPLVTVIESRHFTLAQDSIRQGDTAHHQNVKKWHRFDWQSADVSQTTGLLLIASHDFKLPHPQHWLLINVDNLLIHCQN